MNTLHFKYAVEIEKTRSITQAAENLFMAQPNLSKAIKELENTLGITIFRRTSKGVIPTEQGLKFLSYAKQVLIQIDNMKAIHSPDKPQHQKIKISVPRAGYISKALSDYITGFNSFDNIEVYMRETNSIQTIGDVREQNYDFGIIRFNMKHEKYFTDYLREKSLESQILWDFEMNVLFSPEHPLSQEETIEYHELIKSSIEVAQGDNFVPYYSQSGTVIGYLSSEDDITSRQLYMFDRGSMLDALKTVKNSFMLVSPMTNADTARYGLVQKKCIAEDNNFRDIIIYSSGHNLSEAEMKLVNKICAARNEAAFGV